MYILTITIKQNSRNSPGYDMYDNKFDGKLEVSMRGPHGYLSATNWPLLHVIIYNIMYSYCE